jgi:TolB protein
MLDRQFGMELAVVAPGVVAYGTQSLRQNLSWIDLDRGDASPPTLLTSGNSVDRQPRLAPDGETILFSSNRTGNMDLWTINRTSGTVRQLTDDSANDWDPAFVNDGREIVWSSDRSGNLEIWIANADGSGARQLTQDGVDAENPTATPDGEWIVYMTANPAHRGMWKIRPDGSEATQLWEGAGYISELSPDGRHALFATSQQDGVWIRVVNIETSALLPFRIGVPRELQRASNGSVGRARWTDGGRSIAFMGAVDDELGVFTQAFATSGDTSSTRRRLAGFDPVWVTESFEISLDGSVVLLSNLRPGGTVMLAENVPFVTPPRAP